MTAMHTKREAAAQPRPTWNSARSMLSSLTNRLKGGKPRRATRPKAKMPPRTGRRLSRAGTRSISLVPSVEEDLARGQEQHALGQAVAQDVQQHRGDGQR